MAANQTSPVSGRVLELLMLLDLKAFPPQQYLDTGKDNYSQYVILAYKIAHALKQPEPLALSAFLKQLAQIQNIDLNTCFAARMLVQTLLTF